MKEFAPAIAKARLLIERYPEAELPIRRGAWAVVANASLDSADYPEAERAFAEVLELTPAEDASRQAVVDDLAASIYKQGEQANAAGDARAAAGHFLRIAEAAPTSKIRPLAEYDASAALIQLGELGNAAGVLESLRTEHPEHELQRDATKQLAYVYRREGNPVRAAEEYERVAKEAQSPEEQREALLVAGEMYEGAKAADRALALYLGYVSRFAEPLETAVETRFKIAALQKAKGDDASYREQLREIVKADASAGGGRTARVRFLAAQSALVLSDEAYRRFGEVALVQPFEKNLLEKKRRMDAALGVFEGLVDYEVAGVEGVGAPLGSRSRAAPGVRGRARRGDLPVRGEGDRAPPEEPGAARGPDLQRVDGEEPGRARAARARSLREVRGEQRLDHVARTLRLRVAGSGRARRRSERCARSVASRSRCSSPAAPRRR
jgi:outer membrane protein assembly factor BamD (BamD/ComL family)